MYLKNKNSKYIFQIFFLLNNLICLFTNNICSFDYVWAGSAAQQLGEVNGRGSAQRLVLFILALRNAVDHLIRTPNSYSPSQLQPTPFILAFQRSTRHINNNSPYSSLYSPHSSLSLTLLTHTDSLVLSLLRLNSNNWTFDPKIATTIKLISQGQ